MEIKQIAKLFITLTVISVLTTGCAGRNLSDADGGNAEIQNNNKDPLERFNRSMFKLNNWGDKYIFVPVARKYRNYAPKPVKIALFNFFENITEPITIVSSLLQGKLEKARISTGRFVVNTTIGMLGLIDIAEEINIHKVKEDFGQTLTVWGFPSGPYLVLPIFGPRNLRHLGGLVVDSFAYPPWYLDDSTLKYGLTTVDLIISRERLLGTEELLELQLDPYVFLRESYRQKRISVINDSKNIDEFDEDEFDEDEFDEDEFDDEYDN